MDSARDIVTTYLTSFSAGDLDTARTLVSEGFSFQGPRGRTEGRDQFFAASTWILPYLRGVRILRQWDDGEDVSTLYEYDVETEAGRTSIRISEWTTVRDGVLISTVSIFDAGAAEAAFMAGSPEAA